jgi:hypothetical protein
MQYSSETSKTFIAWDNDFEVSFRGSNVMFDLRLMERRDRPLLFFLSRCLSVCYLVDGELM